MLPLDEYVCDKCGQTVVKQGWFWVLASEAGTGKATFCPGDGGLHEVDEDEEP
jgi:hypothetical protein